VLSRPDSTGPERRLHVHAPAAGIVAFVSLIALLCAAPAGAASQGRSAPELSEAQVATALTKLKEDPNLATTKKSRTLRWVGKSEDRPRTDPGWLGWIRAGFAWAAEGARLLLWVAGGLLVGLLALYVKRFLQSRGARTSAGRFTAPSHVRDLDIRPETLPEDVGAAALESWERGEHRAALALLYRGLLSRLAHVHGVPIRHSSTEGDCLELAARHLPAGKTAYVSRLVRVWQRAVYGGNDPASEEMRALCAGFSAAVDEAASAPRAEQAA
jgi:hypothetical protein